MKYKPGRMGAVPYSTHFFEYEIKERSTVLHLFWGVCTVHTPAD